MHIQENVDNFANVIHIKYVKHMNSVVSQIRAGRSGTIYFVGGQTDTKTGKALSRVLSTEEKRGEIVRIGRGVYLKPERSKYGIVYPSVSSIAIEIAKRDHAQILPSGQYAENMLGLSTQVPTNYTFLTSGSAREIHLDDVDIIFRRGVPKNFAFENRMIAILNQALKSMGKENVSEETLSVIRKLIRNEKDKDSIKRDLSLVAGWIKDIISPILKENTI